MRGTDVSIVDAARIVKNILDTKRPNCEISNISYLSKFVSFGEIHFQSLRSVPLSCALNLYLEKKSYLKPHSMHDIKRVFRRILRMRPALKSAGVSNIGADCLENYLEEIFATPSQFNKARIVLHGFFNFCLRKNFCAENPLSKIPPKKVIEAEIFPLSIPQIKALLANSAAMYGGSCAPACGIMLFAGIRPNEARRMLWGDIDFTERIIRIRRRSSKTGGARQVELHNVLKTWLSPRKKSPEEKICPPGFDAKWKAVRGASGFKGVWVQDVLRHTYASYHAKKFRDLPRLQTDMGHFDLSLLRSRYVNAARISRADADAFFSAKKLFNS